jgi:multidrug efflux pump subunit AcrA (membrane-fusion protein)
MKSFLSVATRSEPTVHVPTAVPEPTADEIIRIFQSESGEIRAGAGPIRSRRSLLLVAALFVSLLVIAGSFQLNRVVTSLYGQIVTTEPTVVMQPFDETIIKTIDVDEGERVKKGQLLGTLDPTFAASNVRQRRPIPVFAGAGLTVKIDQAELKLRFEMALLSRAAVPHIPVPFGRLPIEGPLRQLGLAARDLRIEAGDLQAQRVDPLPLI